ncbi:MAG: hypothetical protein ACRAVC_14940 [Trichormus sp.]
MFLILREGRGQGSRGAGEQGAGVDKVDKGDKGDKVENFRF